jgi:hypothetical protein
LNSGLRDLFCNNNDLVALSQFNENLSIVECHTNQLYSLPVLNENLQSISYANNPIYEIINSNNLYIIKQKLEILYRARHLYYCLKLKRPFRKWLWKLVREPTIIRKYHPMYLIENLGEQDDLDDFLEQWINKTSP